MFKSLRCGVWLSDAARHSIAFDRLVEAEQLSGSEREEYERAVKETLGTMYTGPSSLRRQLLITEYPCANEMSSLFSRD